jgi:FtsH-binding integral membrane protein
MVPVNYALLFGFTVCESVSLSSLTAALTPESVLLSFGVLGITLSGLWVAALSAKENIKVMVFMIIGLILVTILQLIALIILVCLGYFSSAWFILYGVLGAIASGIYVLIDLILIMCPGAMSKDDYILGALMLYVDLIRMLIYIIMIFGKRK